MRRRRIRPCGTRATATGSRRRGRSSRRAPLERRHDGRRRHRRRRLPRPLDGLAAEGARARARRRRARGGARGARAERAERRLRLDALGRPPDPARPGRRRAGGRGLPRLRAGGPRDRRVVRGSRASTPGTAPAARCRSRRATHRSATGTSSSRRARRSARPRRRSRCRASEVAARCASPLFLGGGAPADGRQRPAGPTRARPARAGDRRRASGCTSARPSQRLDRGRRRATRRTGTVRAGAAVLAVNSATAGFAGYRLRARASPRATW